VRLALAFLDEQKFSEDPTITRLSELEELSRSKVLPTVNQRLIVLEIISLLNNPMSSYELYNELRTKFGLKTSYGTLYPWLRQLERSGILSSELVVRKDRLASQQRKRVYSLTELGKVEFQKSLGALTLIMKRIQEAFPMERENEVLVRAIPSASMKEKACA
jgi:DNA-binding PadR family transcriptional regulator